MSWRSGVRPFGALQRRGGKDRGGDVVAEVVPATFQRRQAAADDVVAAAFSGSAGGAVNGIEHVRAKELASASFLQEGEVFGPEGVDERLNVCDCPRPCRHRWSVVWLPCRGVRGCLGRLRPHRLYGPDIGRNSPCLRG